MTEPQLNRLLETVGELRGDVKALLREVERERKDSQESRSRVYERIEHVEKTAVLAGQVAAQARDVAEGVSKLVAEEVKPQTDKLKHLGLKGGGFLTGAALVGGLASQPLLTSIASAFEKVFR